MSWKKTAQNIAGTAMDAARYMAYISKCRLEILAEQERIRRLYTRLGKVYYKDYVTDEEPDEAEYKPLCEKISAAYRRINKLREKMEDAKAAYRGEDFDMDCDEETTEPLMLPEEK